MTESKKIRILFINLRSDYGGGPSHMYDLVKGLNSSFEKYVACFIKNCFIIYMRRAKDDEKQVV